MTALTSHLESHTMATPLGIPLKKRTPDTTVTPSENPATSNPPNAPRMPSQGHSQDDDDDNIPPPPAQPNGEYLCRVTSVYHPIDKETGKAQTWDNGDRKQSKVFFTIDDPNEQRKQQAGKDNCFGVDLEIKLDFGKFYTQTTGYCAALGCPQAAWPKNAKDKTTVAMLGEHILAQTKGKKFLVTAKLVAGKGENKAKLYTNVTKITAPPAPPKAAPKPAPVAVAPAPSPESEESDTSGVESTPDPRTQEQIDSDASAGEG